MASLTTLATLGDITSEQSFQPSDFSFLSQLLYILQKVEAGEDAQAIATLAANLKTSFKKCQMILDHLPGADMSPDEQARVLEEELTVLEKKEHQLANYLSRQVFHYEPTAQLNNQHMNIETESKPEAELGLTMDPIVSNPDEGADSNQMMESTAVVGSDIDHNLSLSVSATATTSEIIPDNTNQDDSGDIAMMLDLPPETSIKIEESNEMQMPSLTTDISSISDGLSLSQTSFDSSVPPLPGLSTGLTLDMDDVKMEELNDQSSL